ncbi:hypothetical protein ACN38_g7204, partial [Penicillium nordicum]
MVLAGYNYNPLHFEFNQLIILPLLSPHIA